MDKLLGYASLALVAFGSVLCADLLMFEYGKTVATCGDAGCMAVWQSPVSHPFGVPLPVYGLIAYLTLGFCLVQTQRSTPWAEAFGAVGRAIGVVGAVLSAALITYSSRVLHVHCPWCLASATAFVTIALLSIVSTTRRKVPLASSVVDLRKSILAISLGVAACMTFHVLLQKGYIGQSPISLGSIAMWPSDGRAIGNAKTARYRCVAIVDFTCPGCQEELRSLIPLVRKQKKVAFALRTILLHGDAAEIAASLSQSALRKGAYWPYVMAATACDPKDGQSYVKAARNVGLTSLPTPSDEEKAHRDDQIVRGAGVASAPNLLLWDGDEFKGTVSVYDMMGLLDQ